MPDPYQNQLGQRVNRFHHLHLVISLSNIPLVDADGVDPKIRPVVECWYRYVVRILSFPGLHGVQKQPEVRFDFEYLIAKTNVQFPWGGLRLELCIRVVPGVDTAT